MIEIIREHRISLPTKVVMLIKTLIVLEGTARQLNPTFNLAELIRPYAQKAVSRRYSAKQLVNRLRKTYGDWDDLIRRVPRDLADILRGVKSGKFEVHLEHRRLEPIVNRLVLGILTAALFIGSTSLCDYQVPPVIRGISVPGFLGCLVSITMGWLLIRAIRRRRD
jgi:ubiquinone biosynthesis protein